MPLIPGSPERPQYHSVKAYLSELAKDIAEMVVDPVKMERFREQLKIYANLWKQWTTFYEADRQGCWTPSMGRPECIFNIFSCSYNLLKDSREEAKRLAGSYALCALIHDSQLPHLDKINTDIIPIEAIEKTLSSPRNTLEARIVGNWNSGPDVREIYLIEEFFNRVKVDLREICNSEKNKLTQASVEKQIQNANELSDTEFIELTAKKFEQRAKKVLSTDETWHDLDRSLKGWFDTVIGRLKKSGFQENDIGLLKYIYKCLLSYTRGINIKSFRGFPDLSMASSARKQASELAAIFKDFAKRVKDNLASEKSEEKEKQKVKPEDKIHSSGNDGDTSMEWDVFICHASEDKEDFVEPLTNALKKAGIKVWYDRFELKLGDSLRGKIDEGLANSRYGVVVLSKSFFNKNWPKAELDALVNRQNGEGKKVILPIWHGIGVEEVRKFSPILASKLAAQSSDSLESIVGQIRNVLNENSTPKKTAKYKRDLAGTEREGFVPHKIELMEQIAKKLRSWADQNKKLIRNFSASLTGPLPPMEYERVVAYLRINNADMAELVQEHYEELISCAKKIDTLTADSSRSAMETAASLVGKLRFLANRLAQTLEVTAQNLILEEPTEAEQDTKSELEGMIEPKPPEILSKILWVLKYGKKHWRLLFVAVILSLCIWFLSKINPFSKKDRIINSETKTDKKVEDITLLYLFKNDFNNLLRKDEDIIFTHKDGSQTIVKSRLYLDFESQTEFVGFYIPSIPETFDICTHLVEDYKIALELRKKIEHSAIGLQPVNTSELKFSGRVFIYHEYPLFEAQKRELFTLYKKHDLSPQFRGTDYVFKKKQIEKTH